jgi:DeoR/GlpR family transcriptional regulator of sugar metabolism
MDAREPADAVFADERQAQIAELVSTQGRARNGELARRFGVSEPTIRKDLSALQRRGLVKRTHGGAIALHPLVDRELAGREATHRDAKHAIARVCLGLIESGDAIFLDSGTTIGSLAAALAAEPLERRSNLSVLTNTLEVARVVAELPSIEHVLLGGQLRPASGSVIGALTLHDLQRFTVDIAFIGVSGFSDLGISVGSVAEAEVKATVIERARRVVVPVDHTKVGATDFARICELDEIDTVVMDRANPQIEQLCASHEIELMVAAEQPTP